MQAVSQEVTPIWNRPLTVEFLQARNAGTLSEHLGIVFTEIGSNYMRARMPVDKRTQQPMGILHGGASCVLAETLGSIAANCVICFETHYCVGLDLNINHVRAAPVGLEYLEATTEPYHIGRSTQVWGIEIRDPHDRLVAISRLTMSVLKRDTASHTIF